MNDLVQRLTRLDASRRTLLSRYVERSRPVFEPIAIIGMSCRFPGAPNLQSYWEMIRDGRQGMSAIPSERWNNDALFSPSGGAGRISVRTGGFLEGVDQFDASFFGIAPREAAKMDPQQRLLLEVTWEALENAGLAPDRTSGSRTGVFIGVGAADYAKVPVTMEDYYGQIDAHCGTGNALSIAANRLSYFFDWHGPSLIVDTACSSSLVALHTAVKHLHSADADMAICGGVNLILTPETTIAFSNARMLSPDGHCRPFDSRANGYVRGEGAGVVVLKRLTDAMAHGDRVLAVVRGSAVNQDGRTSGIAAPNSRSQEAVIRRALAESGLTPEDISYIEAHGTGTPLGDPIELEALARVFGQAATKAPACLLSSVKANIGHLETAAGIASLIKVVLMMRQGQYVPQAEFRELNPHASLANKRLQVSESLAPWEPGSIPRRAGVSSFGFGGTNAHVVLEEATESVAPATKSGIAPIDGDRLVAISAKSGTALQTITRLYADYLSSHPKTPLDSFCYAANTGRGQFGHRVTLTASSSEDLQSKLHALATSDQPIGYHHGFETPKVAFLFTGQGGQYAGMGEQLMRHQPLFAHVMTRCNEIASDCLGTSLLDVMHDHANPDRVSETRYTQPALFALEYSLALLWRSWGIEPMALLGHSVGEYVAATLAGVMTLEDGMRLICKRAELMHACPGTGAMAAVAASAEVVRDRLQGLESRVAIAACNGPRNTVISGDQETVALLGELLVSDGLKVTPLKVTHAFHSPLMDPMLDEFERFASTIPMHQPNLPVVSNLTGDPLTAAPTAAYWRHHLRSPVLFANGIESLVALGPDHIIESGPAPVLLAMGRQVVERESLYWLPTLRLGQPDWRVMLSSLATLYTHGAKVRWEHVQTKPAPLPLPLPNYPFERKRHWYASSSKPSAAVPRMASSSSHPLLGMEIQTATGVRIFDNHLLAEKPEYLSEHKVQGSVVTPAAAYVEIAVAAADTIFGAGEHWVEDLSIQQAMFLAHDEARHVQMVVSGDQQDRRQFKVLSRSSDADPDSSWTLHACGTIVRCSAASIEATESLATANGHAPWRHTQRRPDQGMDAESFYASMLKRGFDYGTRFQVLDDLRQGENEAWALIEINERVRRESQRHRIHPALLDGCLQAMAAIVPPTNGNAQQRSYLPTAIGNFRLCGDPVTATQVYVRRRTVPGQETSAEIIVGDVVLLDADANVVAELLRVKVQSLGATSNVASRASDWLYRLNWTRCSKDTDKASDIGITAAKGEILDASGTDWWVITHAPSSPSITLHSSVANRLITRLRTLHAKCVEVRLSDRFHRLDDVTYEVDATAPEPFAPLCASGASTKWNGWIDLSSFGAETGAPIAENVPPAPYWSSVMPLIRQATRTRFSAAPRIWICTRGGQPVIDGSDCDPNAALLWGLGRTASLEYASGVSMFDCDPNCDVELTAEQLLRELFETDGENQVAYRGSERYVARLAKGGEPDEVDLSDRTKRNLLKLPSAPFKLRLRGTGSFDQLHFDSYRLQPPTGDQVQLRVHATGLNFSDVLKAMGLYPGLTDQEPPLGIECSGVVTAVGPEVTRFKPGDEVMGVVPHSFASHAATAEFALVHKPTSLTHAEAATVPITFLTAHYALCWLARIQPGERVLIHAAAGGVGLAAIQIAHHVGAKVYATAGSDIKRNHVAALGVEHVYNSRGIEFASQILADTDGLGVDIVLNSLPGEAIPKSLSILSAYGRFLEIGKTDIYQDRMIGLSPFQDNLSYFAIDLDRMLRQRPAEIGRLFAEVMTRFDEGAYKPLPASEFKASQTATAFRYMAQRKNIGKVIVTLDAEENATQESSCDGQANTVSVGPNRTYLITGGLGAIGLRLAEWLVEAGATHILLVSRSKPNEIQQSRIQELEARAHVCCIQGDVSDAASLQLGLEQIPSDFPPVSGVLHAAGTLSDGLLYEMDRERFAKPLAAKVDGGWNLHRASLEWPLDFFVLFSSVASVLGSPGQSNYAAANAYIDALAAHRRFHGLPATAINWGPWDEGGMAVDANRSGKISDRGLRLQSPSECITALDRILNTDPLHDHVVMDVSWSGLSAQFSRGCPPLFTAFSKEWESQTTNQKSTVDHSFLNQMTLAVASDRLPLMRSYLSSELGRILGVEPGELLPSQPLSVIGVDSLMAMELKANLEAKLQIEVPMSSLMDGPSIDTLAGHLLPLLSSGSSVESNPASSAASSTQAIDPQSTRGASLLPLQTHAIEPAIFCIHPVGGDLRCYQQLAKCIGQHRHVMAVRPRGVDRDSTPHDNIYELASDYVALIRQHQPVGPYLLIGWSTGGIFAYEMTQQLIAAGQTVHLTFIDTPTSMILEHVDLNDDARFLYDLVNFSNWFSGAAIRIEYAELKEMRSSEALDRILAETKQSGILPASATRADLERRINMCRQHLRAAMNYQPLPIDQPVVLYRPQHTAVLSLASGRQLTDDLGWLPILGDNLVLKRVTGDHFSMLTGIHAEELGTQIVEELSPYTPATPTDR